MSDDKNDFDTKALDNLIKALTETKYVVKVGVLGAKAPRKEGGPNNAEIGAVHEFGDTKVPRRSFLRMPLETQFSKDLEKAGGITEKDIQAIIKDIGFREFTKKIGILAVETILRAFDTGGFGQWLKLSDARIAQRLRLNQGTQKLVVAGSQQLRDSITYEVKKLK